MMYSFCAALFRSRSKIRTGMCWGLLAAVMALPLVSTPSSVQSAIQQSNTIAPLKQTLKRGDRGAAVTRLQRQLRQAGVFRESATGFFGPKTEAAVRQFQRSRGLPVDGIAGPRTLNALTAATTPFEPFQHGAQGELVREMQLRLALLGYLNGSVTSNFDNTTKNALIQFQRSRGLGADGVVGRSTWTSLRNSISTAQVQSMQRRLQTAGFYTGAIDGRLTVRTQRAVAAAQRVYAVGADDILRGSY